MQRLFFSLKFTASQQQQLLPYQQQALKICPESKAVDSDNLHLTLFFLGQVDAIKQQHLVATAQQIKAEAFSLTLDYLACFARPKILYLAPSIIAPELLQLQQQLASICNVAGFSEIHDKYRPHITLARHALCPATLPLPVQPLALAVSQFALYLSAQQEGRIRYQPLYSFSLL
ncbi:2'-5' RNA ligase [Arsukibacterium tuosuense]|uniref:RNA 2',3'-cyclic phosphodiesterase n=1 Tax=Arsukibacterium tuosuense TaxID=1323745 RepID=A0A285IA07_9GAMM|nr:RNA 2',3'-cyclic phosphodiesterase [Arsukibacterium tuosuense]SNY44798.1 2'-5' RNA ligase [Arsukibacterium tuosuense]